jgi:hypothetical protein
MLLGFRIANVSGTIEGGLRSDGDRNLFASVTGISQAESLFGGTLTLWGNPAAAAHDSERGHCIRNGGSCPVEGTPPPFITLPRSCTGPLGTRLRADSRESPGIWTEASALSPGMEGCGRLGLSPTIGFQPSANLPSSASSLDVGVDLDNPGLTDPAGIAQSDLRGARFLLPPGMTFNPAFAEGLGVCGVEEFGREALASEPGAGCPESSKIGTAALVSPLLEQPLKGPVFVARPGGAGAASDASLDLALYMVLRQPALGILVKQRLAIEPDPTDGRLTATAADLPQIPFSHFELHFRQGIPTPVVTPPTCGHQAVRYELEPWAGGQPVVGDAGFDLQGSCGQPGFGPTLTAGVTHPRAGGSTFVATLARADDEKVPDGLSLQLPPGLAANFGDVPLCPEASAAVGDCPSASRASPPEPGRTRSGSPRRESRRARSTLPAPIVARPSASRSSCRRLPGPSTSAPWCSAPRSTSTVAPRKRVSTSTACRGC